MNVVTVARRHDVRLQLPVPPEPVALKQILRARAEEAPRRAAELLVDRHEVAAFLWQRWGSDLCAAGVVHDSFLEILAEYRRELWYWVWGNRTWAQCAEGLAGRLTRRSGPCHDRGALTKQEEERRATQS